METPQMASYLQRWEQQKAQSRRNRRSSGVGDELSLISAMEREQRDDSFDLPAVDAFPAAEAARAKMPTDDEFVDAATFLKKNELGGDDSFSEDVGALADTDHWERTSSSGRPSDFFERKSRNLDHVELSSPTNVDDPLFEGGEDEEVDDAGLHTPKEQSSPTDPRQGVAHHDRFERSSGLSGSGTALSSGYDIHFDNTKLMYTPNSLKYLQEKSRFMSDDATGSGKQFIHSVADHTGEAKAVTKKTPSLPDQDIPEDPSPEYVANLQRGPGVIKETLNEIDALIDNSIRLALSPPDEDPLGVELPDDVREFVREYERPLESMLPLSRTTDSWGEDASISLIDDDANRRSRDLDQLSNSTEPTRPTTNGVRRSRSQETPELDTIREGPCPSNTNSASRSQLSDDSHNQLAKESRYLTENRTNSPSNHKAHTNSGQANHRKRFNGVNSKSEGPKSRATSATLDQSLAEVAATQNPFRDEAYQETENVKSSSEVQDNHNEEDSFASIDEYRRQQLGDREDNESLQDQSLDSEATMNGVRFRYGENIQHSRRDSRKRPVDDHNRVLNTFKPRSAAVQKHSIPSDRVLDILERNKLHVTMETAMMPRRCRRFLCSVGDIMSEQIVFTNGGNSVGRICVSLLPLSTGCQQFSVSPAVLELGPRASSAFHVTFNARYAGAVSGIVQFRGVGVDSLFHPYEVVIEASVQRRLELDHPKNTRPTKQREEVATSERVQELQASSSVDQVEVSPMFIRFDHVRGKSGEASVLKAKLLLANNTSQTLPFKVRALENLKVRPATGMIQPASEVIVSVLPISQPFVRQRSSDETNSSLSTPRAEDWFGSLTVRVGQTYRREVSVVVDRRVVQMLPPFDEIARFRHQLSSQTDSFYYTKRGKRRGLYFHARAVEFGCCNVGESHEVPVYVCNGSKTPMTVFLQDLQEPFSCAYSTTTIEPRKFIEVMVTFTPKVVGKVATSLFAYSVTDKAVVTLVARGI